MEATVIELERSNVEISVSNQFRCGVTGVIWC